MHLTKLKVARTQLEIADTIYAALTASVVTNYTF